jgi:hypothetical protein
VALMGSTIGIDKGSVKVVFGWKGTYVITVTFLIKHVIYNKGRAKYLYWADTPE